jgi:hypothetical protein
MAIVYQHRRKDNGDIFYIGIGKDENRAYVYGRNYLWEEVVKETDYFVDILYKNISVEEAGKIEIELIKKLGRKDLKLGKLTNLTDGGQYNTSTKGKYIVYKNESHKSIYKEDLDYYISLGWKRGMSSSFKDKLKWSKTRKETYKNDYWTKEKRENKSKNVSGENNPRYGKKHTNETIEKMSLSHKGKVGLIGEKNPMYNKFGKNHPKSKKINQYTLNEEYIKTWESIKEAGYILGISHIDQVCKGHRKSAGGFKWNYYIENV